MKKYVTAIDIGTTKIVALAGVKESGTVRILGTGSVETPQSSVKRGVVLNIDEVSKAINEAVRIAESASGIKFRSAFVGIAGQHISSRQSSHSLIIPSEDFEIKQSDVDKLRDDMYKMALQPGETIIHVIPQSYNVDKETGIINPVGMYGRQLKGNFHIVIGEVTSAKNIERCIERLGIQVNGLYLEPLASASAVLTDDEMEAGVALVDIGGGTTDIAIYYENVLRYTAVIPYGGSNVTSDIKTGCSILSKQAETLKLQHGSALVIPGAPDATAVVPGINGRDSKSISILYLSQIIQARMVESIAQIEHHLRNSGFRHKLGAGISLTGGGAMLKNLHILMKQRMGLDVRLAYPMRKYIGDNEELNKPQYSTSVGLITLGFEEYETITLHSDSLENINAEEARERLAKEQEIAELAERKRKEEEAAKQKEWEEERARMEAALKAERDKIEQQKIIDELAAKEERERERLRLIKIEEDKRIEQERIIAELKAEQERIKAEELEEAERIRKRNPISSFLSTLKKNLTVFQVNDDDTPLQ